MKKTILFAWACLSFLSVSARKGVTLHFEKGAGYYKVLHVPLSYKGIPMEVSAFLVLPIGNMPNTEENKYLTHVWLAFQKPNSSTHDMSLGAICEIYKAEDLNRDMNLKKIEVDKALQWICTNLDVHNRIPEHIKYGYEVVANVMAKINWENPEKSKIKIKLKDSVFDKRKMYSTKMRESFFRQAREGEDYIQNGHLYKWDEKQHTWKQKRKY